MSDPQKIWRMIDKFRSCMLVTHQGEALRARPMTPFALPDENRICFLARRAAKDEEIEADSAVNLSFSDGAQQHLSISGRASISTDVELKRRLWGPMSQAFLPEGPESPQTLTIIVTPVSAEYWDGDNAVSSLIKIGAALVKGEEPDIGDSGKVTM